MFSPFILLFVTCAFCIVMLLVLFGLLRLAMPGVREWFAANAAAAVALPLFAARGVVPDFLSIEIANVLMLSAGVLMLAGYRRHFSCPVQTKRLAAAVAMTLGLVAVFHYALDSTAMRIVAVSAFHAAACLGIGFTVMRGPKSAQAGYSYWFAAGAAFALGFGHAVRLAVYAVQMRDAVEFFHSGGWNIAFLSIGTLAMPMMTLGAVLIAYDTLVARAEDMANHDFLTNAWTRRAFFEMAERERMRVTRNGGALSLILFDVDHFKAINDTYGHDAGDRVLIDIVKRIGACIRGIDYCARLGGEEFAVLLPGADRKKALIIAERIRAAVARMPMPATGGAGDCGIVCTISAGVATLERSDESIAALLRRTDAALYAAKAGGRNAVADAQGLVQPALANA